MSTVTKEGVKRALEKGLYTNCDRPSTCSANWWKNFTCIIDENKCSIPFVQCVRCKSLLAYDSRKNGTSTLKAHSNSCKIPASGTHHSIDRMLAKSSNVSADTKRLVADACARFCAYDMRAFEIVNGRGFQHLCQTLLSVGHEAKERMDASLLLPNPTTVSRRVQSLADGNWSTTDWILESVYLSS